MPDNLHDDLMARARILDQQAGQSPARGFMAQYLRAFAREIELYPGGAAEPWLAQQLAEITQVCQDLIEQLKDKS